MCPNCAWVLIEFESGKVDPQLPSEDATGRPKEAARKAGKVMWVQGERYVSPWE
jgi:hypothetical protein